VEADEFNGNWYMNITKWRDEVVKDGKEGRVVFDEDNMLDATSGWLQSRFRIVYRVRECIYNKHVNKYKYC
jgi:hypothetical protein